MFNEDGSGTPGTLIPAFRDIELSALPEDRCSVADFYRFVAGDLLAFEGSATGDDVGLLNADDLDVSYDWTVGGFTFTSDTLTPTFSTPIPDALFETDGRLPLGILATITPAVGKAFWFCDASDCSEALFLSSGQSFEINGLGASAEFVVPLPAGGLLMLTVLMGAGGLRRLRR
ncbi:hypothetical protein HK107_13510 [Parvularcula sp. ZS-1/3]|uniref:Uncharacterized protein n=1 Tax=Parvularcula mediterranea TaxID=2732508 RepID=A0A7Y3RNK9_9PROT|nr:VPLPA-CTERM sorting domain-containing protein [Parvularcula mediterranea]NNU17343.1 hypothetical protein [Parvularcula mediterranea]